MSPTGGLPYLRSGTEDTRNAASICTCHVVIRTCHVVEYSLSSAYSGNHIVPTASSTVGAGNDSVVGFGAFMKTLFIHAKRVAFTFLE